MDREVEKWKEKIPSHWEVKKLGELCNTTSGGTPSRGNKNYYNGKIPWVKSGELEKGIIYDTEEKISEEGVKASSAKIFPKGTLLIALYGATIGKLAFLGVDAATNQAICGIFKSDHLDSKYLYFYLFFSKPTLVNQSIGGAQPNISQAIIRGAPIPLPPIAEQQSIVAKIEELFSELEKGKEQLETALAQLKVYRQSLLQAAFSGKLTNPDVKEGELPEGWKWVKLGDVIDTCLGKMLDKSKNKGTLQPYLRNINVRWGMFELVSLEQMKFEPNEEERYSIRKDDLIVCEGGEPGRSAIWKNQTKNIKIQKALHRVRTHSNLKVDFLYHYMKYSAISGILEKYFTGTTIKHLTGQGLKKIEIPLPPLIDQEEIVQILESKLTVCDKIEETIKQSLAQADVLRQSILKQAFEGKLVGG